MLDSGIEVGPLTRWQQFVEQWSAPERPDHTEHRERLTVILAREIAAEASATQSFRMLQAARPGAQSVSRDTPSELRAIIEDVDSLQNQLKATLNDHGPKKH